ncbi:MAG: hypothetical protein IJ422_01610 [Oscillospiraceae bacterium]|nr:hypothetical protein [Oscillospiraceae bacterium]
MAPFLENGRKKYQKKGNILPQYLTLNFIINLCKKQEFFGGYNYIRIAEKPGFVCAYYTLMKNGVERSILPALPAVNDHLPHGETKPPAL